MRIAGLVLSGVFILGGITAQEQLSAQDQLPVQTASPLPVESASGTPLPEQSAGPVPALASPAPSPAVSASPALSWADCLSRALQNGPDFLNLNAQWSVSREAYAQALAKTGFTLNATAGYSLAGASDSAHVDGAADPTLTSAGAGNMSGVSNSLNLPQNISGGLTMSAGNTKASLSVSQSLPIQLKTVGSAEEGIKPGTLVLAGSVSQVLWDGYEGGLPQATVKKAQATLDAQHSAWQANLLTLAGKYQTTFLALVQAQETLGVQTRIRDQKKLGRDLLQTRFSLNQASEIDTRSAALALKTTEQDLKAASQSRRAAAMRLAIATGLPPDQDLAVESPPDPVLPAFDENEAVKLALEHRSDLMLLVQNLGSSMIDLATANAQLSPVVTLGGTPSLAYKWDTGGVAFALGVNLKLSLPLTDAGLAGHQAESARNLQAAWHIQIDQLQKSIETDTRDLYRQLTIKYERWLLARESSELAQRQYDIISQAVGFGTGKPRDLLDSGINLANVLNLEVQAKSAVFAAWSQLVTSMAFDPRDQAAPKE